MRKARFNKSARVKKEMSIRFNSDEVDLIVEDDTITIKSLVQAKDIVKVIEVPTGKDIVKVIEVQKPNNIPNFHPLIPSKKPIDWPTWPTAPYIS